MTKQQQKLFNRLTGKRYLVEHRNNTYGIHYLMYDNGNMVDGPFPSVTVKSMINKGFLLADSEKIRRSE